MAIDGTLLFTVCATAATGLLAGASLDQSIKQLPARHRLGVVAFSAYSSAADLGPGVLWYAILGVGTALLVILATVFSFLSPVGPGRSIPFVTAGALALLHSLVTSRAAPLNFSQRKAAGDEAVLKIVFDRFERWQTVRAILQLMGFGAMLWALVTLLAA
jgi:hypothetical protein